MGPQADGPLARGGFTDAIGRDRTYVVKVETGAVTRVSIETFDSLVAALHLEDRRAILARPHALVEVAA